MSRTKVKQNVIDASFGNILEQIVYRADGRTIATKQGNITVQNVTAWQGTPGSAHTAVTGSGIDYTPPTGALHVHYQFYCNLGYYVNNPLYHFKVQLDNSSGTLTDITESRRTYYAPDLRDFWIVAGETYIRINGTEDVANEQVGTWTSARTIQTTFRSYSNTYDGAAHRLFHWDGSSDTNRYIKPLIKITAYS